MNMLVSRIDSLHVCPGNPDARFVAMCCPIQLTDGSVNAIQDGYYPVTLNGKRFMTTVRTTSCELLVGGLKCVHC